MRLVCNAYGLDFSFDENHVAELLIENSEAFLRFLTQMNAQFRGEDDLLILSEADKELRLDKMADVIIDPFQMDVNNKKILTKIYQSIVEESQDTNLEWLLNLKSELERYIMDACEKSEYALTYDSNPDFADLLKMFDVHVDNTEMDMAERLISYVKLSHRVLNTSFFIFVNLKSYFSSKKLEQIFQTLCYEQVNILLLERYDSNVCEYEKRVIIDKDACVICDN